MRLALQLAVRAQGRTRPNPMVGAVVVRQGQVKGQGFHRRVGLAHAEVLALTQAGRHARGATLYVSLEPCAHTGRTPPCTEAIKRAKIQRVVVAMIDPNPKNRGRGLRWLRRHGIQTTLGVLKREANALNRVFVTWMREGRPFVTVKVAQSLDGKIATRMGTSRWISSPKARQWVHRLRSQVDAILVGVNTVLKDNPRLTVRSEVRGQRSEVRREPIKVILDSHLRTPPSARIFSSGGPVIVATTQSASADREKRLRQKGAEIWRFPSQKGRVSLPALLRRLAKREISHLLVEGGGEVIASAFQAQAVDRLVCIVAPSLIGGREAPTSVEGEGAVSLQQAVSLKNLSVGRLGSDLLITAEVG